MGSIISAIEEAKYDEYCKDCDTFGVEPVSWYTFRDNVRIYQRKNKKRNKIVEDGK